MEESSSATSKPVGEGVHHTVTIHKYSTLDAQTQRVALERIAAINQVTSTTFGNKTWSNYTPMIQQRLANPEGGAKDTLFVAQKAGQFIGYVAFYTRKDQLACTWDLKETEAYCSWTAVDPEHRGGGIAMDLKLKIFEEDSGITTFKGHIKKTNDASIRIVEKFREKGYTVTCQDLGDKYFYTITKPKK